MSEQGTRAEKAKRATRTVFAASQSAARASATAASGTSRAVHRLTRASGAGRTGLANLIELTAAGNVGDAFVIVALAGTLFFNTSLDQARSQVILYPARHDGTVHLSRAVHRADAGPGAAGPPLHHGGHHARQGPALLGDVRAPCTTR